MAEAFVTDRQTGKSYRVRGSRVSFRPWTPVVSLIQGIYSTEPEFARRILRNRIYCTYEPTEMCLGMVKVSAKSLSRVPGSQALDLDPSSVTELPENPEVAISVPQALHWESPAQAMGHARERLTQVRRGPVLYESDRPVAALLVSESGELLQEAVNTNALNRTLHAEVNLLQGWWARTGRPIPKGATIYVTLQCCRMCAGMIVWCAEDSSALRVLYGEPDAGKMAQNTALSKGIERRFLDA